MALFLVRLDLHLEVAQGLDLHLEVAQGLDSHLGVAHFLISPSVSGVLAPEFNSVFETLGSWINLGLGRRSQGGYASLELGCPVRAWALYPWDGVGSLNPCPLIPFIFLQTYLVHWEFYLVSALGVRL